MSIINQLKHDMTPVGRTCPVEGGHRLSCPETGLEYHVHATPRTVRRLGGALVASLGLHACLVLVAIILGMLAAPAATEQWMVIQEVFLGSPGGDGSPGDGAADEAGAAPAQVVQEVVQTVPEVPAVTSIQPPKPDTPREKRQIKPKSPPQTPAPVPANIQAVGAGDANQTSQGSGTAASEQGSGGGGTGGGRFEGEFGSGSGPRFASRVQPNYPLHAKRLGKEGVVVLRLTIDEGGRLNTAEIVEKAGAGLDEAALEAVKSSTYLPATLHGRTVPSRAILRIRFQLTAT